MNDRTAAYAYTVTVQLYFEALHIETQKATAMQDAQEQSL